MTHISPEQLKDLMESPAEFQLWDVRDAVQFEQERISEINRPLFELPGMLPELEEFKNDNIVVYCNTGDHSETAAAFLSQSGFQDVKNLEGGLEAWKKFNNT